MKKKILPILFFILIMQLFVVPLVSASGTSVTFTNPLQYETVEDLLGNVLNKLQGIIVVISIIFIIIGAIIYMTSAGNDAQMKLGKGAIFAALIGMAIGVAAPSFLKEIGSILGWTPTDPQVTGALSLSQIALNTLNFLLGVVGTLALIMLIIGAIMYFGAGADEKSVEKGKSIVKYAIIGITIALASLLVVKQIANIITSTS